MDRSSPHNNNIDIINISKRRTGIMATKPTVKEKSMATIVFGIDNCGGGYAIVGGKLRKIPPRGPSYEKIAAALKVVLKEMKL
jgi:hypothetical protein